MMSGQASLSSLIDQRSTLKVCTPQPPLFNLIWTCLTQRRLPCRTVLVLSSECSEESAGYHEPPRAIQYYHASGREKKYRRYLDCDHWHAGDPRGPLCDLEVHQTWLARPLAR